jgi:cell wall-associated NlpC family hydrolase
LRHALAAGAFALLLSGSFAVASANEQPHTGENYTQTSLTENVQSPDVAAWTSRLIVERSSSGKHGEIRSFAGGVLARTSKIATELTKSALRFLGTPYVFGGTSTSGFDCSGYVQHVFAMLGISLPRTADAQFYAGHATKGGLRPGDLVFFQTYEPGPSHVGIYLGNGQFAHASSSHGVMVSHLSDSYWAARYLGAKRLIAQR